MSELFGFIKIYNGSQTNAKDPQVLTFSGNIMTGYEKLRNCQGGTIFPYWQDFFYLVVMSSYIYPISIHFGYFDINLFNNELTLVWLFSAYWPKWYSSSMWFIWMCVIMVPSIENIHFSFFLLNDYTYPSNKTILFPFLFLPIGSTLQFRVYYLDSPFLWWTLLIIILLARFFR